MPSVEARGFTELAGKVRQVPNAIADEMSALAIESMADIEDDVSTYPPQPPYMGMAKYGSKIQSYVRTGKYGALVHSSVEAYSESVTGHVESLAEYSEWLRGYSDGSYLGAWMHRPFWQSLWALIQKWLPIITDRTQQRIAHVVERLLGS